MTSDFPVIVDACVLVRSDQDSLNRRFNVASLMIYRISRQTCASQHGSVVSRESGHTVPGRSPCQTASYPRVRMASREMLPALPEFLEANYVRSSSR